MSEQAKIISIFKRTATANWRIGISYSGQFMSLDLNTYITAGARFNRFLDAAEKSRKRYPIDMTFYHLTEDRGIDIRLTGGRIHYVDGPLSLLQLLPKARINESGTIMDNPFALPNLVFENEEMRNTVTREVSQEIASANQNYMILARVKEVEDGDTLYVGDVLQYGKTLQELNFSMKKGTSIRFNGVDTPEKRTSETGGGKYKDQKNARFGKLWGVTMADMYDIADEATKQTKKWLPEGSIVILIANRTKDGGYPSVDAYGRWLCDVYSTGGVTNVAKVNEDLRKGKPFIHCCKSLLSTKSKIFPHIPLGFFEMDDAIRDSSVLNPLLWVTELDIPVFDGGGNTVTPVGGAATGSVPDVAVDSTLDDVTVPSFFLDPKTVEIRDTEDPISNANDFFTRLDDRFEEFVEGIEDEDDLPYHTKMRIGDTILTCPPINIRVNKQANISAIKTMRTKSSILVNNGQTMTTITMDLYFHDIEAINGRPIPFKKGSEENFIVDGLRPLLAQFAKCPFLPIDNYHLNQSFGIFDVALLDIEVNTIPNFPESLMATITLVEFNSEAYLNDKYCLAESVNYPMLRWYYNESLRDRGYKYRFFRPLGDKMDHKITFKVADEAYLSSRKDAVNYLKTADSPEKRRADAAENTTVIGLKADYERAEAIVKSYDIHNGYSFRKYDVIDYENHTTTKSKELFVEKYPELKDEGIKEDWQSLANARFKEMYDGFDMGVDTGDSTFYSYKSFINLNKNIFIPPKGRLFFHKFIKNWGSNKDEVLSCIDLDKLTMATGYGIFLIEKMDNVDNHAKLMSIVNEDGYCTECKRYAVVASPDNINVLREIMANHTDVEDRLEEYEEEYNKYVRIVNATEIAIPMKEYEIPGRFITTNINTSFSNEFSVIKTKASNGPTMQFMGAGDSTINFTVEMDAVSVEALTNLINLSDRYCKEYNQGITNGFLEIQNDLANMFGIKSIMFESCQIETVEDYPGRFRATIQAIAFDKTQKQREELKAISNNTRDVSKDILDGNTVAYASDRMFEARLSQLEMYPDLELPTYDQLDIVLGKIDAGITKYKRRSDAIYVDPDFYFSTNRTFRDEIEYAYNKDHQLNMYDATGTVVATSNRGTNKLFDTTQEDWDRLKHVQEQEETEPVGWMKDWSEQSELLESENRPASSSSGTSEAKNAEVKAFFEKTGIDAAPYEVFPTWEEWQEIWGDEADKTRYQRLSEKPQPEEHTIYRKMDKWIDEYFGEYVTEKKWITELSTMDFDKINQPDSSMNYDNGALDWDSDKIQSSTAKAAYAKPDRYYAANYHYRYCNVLSKDQVKKVKEWENGDKEGLTNDDGSAKTTPHIVRPKVKNKYVSMNDISKHKGKPPKERLMAYMKAFLNVASIWKQYADGKPVLNRKRTRVGIAYVDISSEDMTLNEAKKLTYDWQYNLKTAIKQLAEHYKKASKLADDCYNYSFTCRPLDAMFYYYENPDGQATTVKHMKKSTLCTSIMSEFNSYTKRPYNTRGGYNNKVYLYTRGEEEKNVLIPSGNASYYKDKLLELEYYQKTQMDKNNVEISADNWKEMKKVMETFLAEKSVEYLHEKYLKHLKKLHKLHNRNWKWTDGIGSSRTDSNGYTYSEKIHSLGAELYEYLNKQEQAVANAIDEDAKQLVADEDPLVMYRTMFYDLRKYDQRGRMVRAFPTFSMHVIHEGDWMGKYKFWDNFYGYNALESIDIHRSRKIAADTAVISMSNVYSNLSTRRIDIDYLDREMKFWDNLIFSNPSQEMLDKKANETHNNIYLETGARVHLRMGYGSSARDLPVVFNGTITEMEVGDVIEIVCQGDGVELGNQVSADPDETAGGFFTVTEPRDIICKLMSSKGNWFKDWLNHVAENRLFKDNPLGIMHFGAPFDQNTQSKPLGNLSWFNSEYGEVCQNIYSTNGAPTFSEWLHPNGERADIFNDFSWTRLWEKRYKLHNPGASNNVKVDLYGMTVWDVIQTICLTSPDYIAAVAPFETRSTLFFGKPYWPCVFNYDSTYEWHLEEKAWSRTLEKENRRSYMQMKYYSTHQDIIENNIRASEDNLFTNVLVQYDGKETPIIYADADIRYDKQKTRVIEADLRTMPFNYYTSEVMATYYGASVLKDNLKDMYKGNILVVGDPTVKPHDLMYIHDDIYDMNGNCLVKAVTHHMSLETGFVTSIEPDLLVANDDAVLIEFGKWATSFATNLVASTVSASVVKKAGKAALNRWFLDGDKLPSKVLDSLHDKAIGSYLKSITDNDDDFKKLKNLHNAIGKAKDKTGKKAAREAFSKACKEMYTALEAIEKKVERETIGDSVKYFTKRTFTFAARNSYKGLAAGASALTTSRNLMVAGKTLYSFNPIGLMVNIATWIAGETLFEHYRRFKENLQSVICMPLTYRGKELTAGINNHSGMVYGDPPGKMDLYFDATFGNTDSSVENEFGILGVQLANFFSGQGGRYKNEKKEESLAELFK